MIDITLKSKREPKTTYPYTGYKGYTPTTHAPSQQTQVHQTSVTEAINNVVKLTSNSNKNKQLFDEAVRRDKIIKTLVEGVTYKENDRVMFVRPADEKKYGKHVIIEKILKSYGQWPKNEPWPDNDNPMIVHLVIKDKDDERLFCTTNYVKPYNSVEAAQRNE